MTNGTQGVPYQHERRNMHNALNKLGLGLSNGQIYKGDLVLISDNNGVRLSVCSEIFEKGSFTYIRTYDTYYDIEYRRCSLVKRVVTHSTESVLLCILVLIISEAVFSASLIGGGDWFLNILTGAISGGALLILYKFATKTSLTRYFSRFTNQHTSNYSWDSW